MKVFMESFSKGLVAVMDARMFFAAVGVAVLMWAAAKILFPDE